MARTNITEATDVLQNHPLEVKLFHSTGPITFLWLIIRVYLGYQWFEAGLEKIGNPQWMNGTSLAGFWANAIKNSTGAHPSVGFTWYADFLKMLSDAQAQSWFAPLVAYGELLAGIALILGLFTGIAAFAAAFMNFNFMLAGSAGVNPLYFVLGIVLIMAWKNAGYWGLDRIVLPGIGTPWRLGSLLRRHPQPVTISPDA